jgi:hypothetical protein
MKELTPEEIEKIPKGDYCYKILEITDSGKIKTEPCPYYFKNELGYGDCKLFEVLNGEGDNFDPCLDDQCKSCGYNYSDELDIE